METATTIAELIAPVLVIGIIAWAWVARANQKDRNRQAAVQMLMDKGHSIDDPKVVELLTPGRKEDERRTWTEAYFILQVAGSLAIAVGIGLAVMLAVFGNLENDPKAGAVGLALGVLLLFIGAGLLLCTRFVPKPGKGSGSG